MDKQVIAPYVRAMKLESLEASINVADQTLLYFQHIKHNLSITPDPAVCVALSLYKLDYSNQSRLEQLAKMHGIPLNIFFRRCSETRHLLNLPLEISFEEIAKSINIPVRFTITTNKIYDDLKNELPGDETLNRASVKAAITLVVAVKRGYKRDEILESLSRLISADPKDILDTELIIRTLIGKRYGVAPKSRNPQKQTKETPDEIKKSVHEELEKMKLQQTKKKDGKKIQAKLSFDVIPRKEKFTEKNNVLES